MLYMPNKVARRRERRGRKKGKRKMKKKKEREREKVLKGRRIVTYLLYGALLPFIISAI